MSIINGLSAMGESVAKTMATLTVEERRAELEERRLALAYEMQRPERDREFASNESLRKTKEENLRSEMEERRLTRDQDERLLGMVPGLPGRNKGMINNSGEPLKETTETGKKYVAYLTDTHGYSPVAAATIVGNLIQESTLNPKAVHDNNTGYGMAGWRLERRDALYNFAKEQKRDVNDPTLQLDFFAHELKSGDMGAKRADAMLKNAKTPEEATEALMHFFRPAGYTPANPRGGLAFDNRVRYSQSLTAGATPIGTAEPGAASRPLTSVGGAEPGAASRPLTPVGGVPASDQLSGSDVPTQGGTQPPYATPGKPRVDPLAFAPLTLSKRYGAFGKAMIDIGNSERDSELKEREFQFNIEKEKRESADREGKRRLEELNAKVSPDGKPNTALSDAEAEAERKKGEAGLGTKVAAALIDKAVDQFIDKERPKGLAIQETVSNLHNVRRLVEAGAITGSGTETRNTLAQIAATMGFDSVEATVTPAYLGALAGQIVANAKQLGVNPTNRDNEIIAQSTGANSSNSKEAVLALLTVQEDLMRKAHERYLLEAGRVTSLRGVKEAYGDGYFKLPKPPTYAEWTAQAPPLELGKAKAPAPSSAGALPSPNKREFGQVYSTPKGPHIWMGTGWAAVPTVEPQ